MVKSIKNRFEIVCKVLTPDFSVSSVRGSARVRHFSLAPTSKGGGMSLLIFNSLGYPVNLRLRVAGCSSDSIIYKYAYNQVVGLINKLLISNLNDLLDRARSPILESD
jgi:hypothetical protein